MSVMSSGASWVDCRLMLITVLICRATFCSCTWAKILFVQGRLLFSMLMWAVYWVLILFEYILLQIQHFILVIYVLISVLNLIFISDSSVDCVLGWNFLHVKTKTTSPFYFDIYYPCHASVLIILFWYLLMSCIILYFSSRIFSFM